MHCAAQKTMELLKMEVQLKNCIFGIADRPILSRGTLNKIQPVYNVFLKLRLYCSAKLLNTNNPT